MTEAAKDISRKLNMDISAEGIEGEIEKLTDNIKNQEEVLARHKKDMNANEIKKIDEIVADFMERYDEYKNKIKDYRDKYVFNWTNSGEIGGKYIIELLQAS